MRCEIMTLIDSIDLANYHYSFLSATHWTSFYAIFQDQFKRLDDFCNVIMIHKQIR